MNLNVYLKNNEYDNHRVIKWIVFFHDQVIKDDVSAEMIMTIMLIAVK